jgi:acetylornithine/succinyldiaminopimelate/putrescine aminotransferase
MNMAHTSAKPHNNDYYLGCLAEMRKHGGKANTKGLPDNILQDFLSADPALATAIERAHTEFDALKTSQAELLALDETEQALRVQDGYLNFYAEDEVNPYVALAAQGPWIITLKGAVVYDCGGYGMLGLGHAPEAVLAAMNQTHVMANVMTPSISQMGLVEALRQEIGHTRSDSAGFDRFLCLNSGSEAVSIASRIADINAREMTDPDGRHADKPIRSASLTGSFHGRTDRPARHSDSCLAKYKQYLASFRDSDQLQTIEPNNIESLEATFRQAEADGVFIETFFMEPVMGEGNPGLSITPEFYLRARELTAEHGTLFLVDSIQAGLRARGVLSIIDYPGFQDLPPPDMEVYSKALNAGQYPLSVLALSSAAADLYKKGLYGNTMTSNPRAADVAVQVLSSLTPELRKNIVARGEELVAGLKELAEELGGPITGVQGTGLLFSCELDPRFKCSGAGSTEEYLRQNGLGVIHGGANSLRYTPGFQISEAEVALILERTRDALLKGPGTD